MPTYMIPTLVCEFRIFHPCPPVRPILGLRVRLGCASPCAARSAINYQSILIVELSTFGQDQ
jgi:hypothetical protein